MMLMYEAAKEGLFHNKQRLRMCNMHCSTRKRKETKSLVQWRIQALPQPKFSKFHAVSFS